MIKIITFTDSRMTISANKCVQSAMKHGCTDYSIWTPGDLSQEFRETMAPVLFSERGGGFYCWKPYIVHQEMKRLNDGDILVYCDAGNTWIDNVEWAISAMDQDILFFDNHFKHVEWCKMDVVAAMLPMDYIASPINLEFNWQTQVQASTFFIRVTSETRKFIQEWYAWSLMPGMIDNEPSILPNVPGFQEHRWDQSILTCLQIKYRYRLHWFPSHTNLHREDSKREYPVLFEHNRKRNHEWK